MLKFRFLGFLKKFAITLSFLVLTTWLALARPFVFYGPKDLDGPRADSALLESHTKRLSTELSPRDYRNVNNLNRAADWISSEFSQNSQKVWLQKFTQDGVEYKNEISEYASAGNVTQDTIIIGAHYDACGEFPAADDNASGIAGLLELSRLVSLKPLPFKVVLVAYTLEEPPFGGTNKMGSAIHAASVLESGEKIRLMISLEMIGYFSDKANSQSYPLPLLNLFYPSAGNFIAVV